MARKSPPDVDSSRPRETRFGPSPPPPFPETSQSRQLWKMNLVSQRLARGRRWRNGCRSDGDWQSNQIKSN